MKKILLLMVAALLTTFAMSCSQTKSNDEKEKADSIQKKAKPKQKPTIVGDWYGFKYSHQPITTVTGVGFPIAIGAPNHIYMFNFFSFKSDGKLALYQVPDYSIDYEFKWVDKGDYLSVTDEFDRQTSVVMQIKELTDSTCTIRYVDGSTDIYVCCSKNPNRRREYFEWFYNKSVKDEYKMDVEKFKDADEWKIDKDHYRSKL